MGCCFKGVRLYGRFYFVIEGYGVMKLVKAGPDPEKRECYFQGVSFISNHNKIDRYPLSCTIHIMLSGCLCEVSYIHFRNDIYLGRVSWMITGF